MTTEPLQSALPPGPAGSTGASEGPDGTLRYHDIKGADLGPADDSGAPQDAPSAAPQAAGSPTENDPWSAAGAVPALAPGEKEDPWEAAGAVPAEAPKESGWHKGVRQLSRGMDMVNDVFTGGAATASRHLAEGSAQERTTVGSLVDTGKELTDAAKEAIHGNGQRAAQKIYEALPDNAKEKNRQAMEAAGDVLTGHLGKAVTDFAKEEVSQFVTPGSAIEKGIQQMNPAFKGTAGLPAFTAAPVVDVAQHIDAHEHPMMKALAENAQDLTSIQNLIMLAGTEGAGTAGGPVVDALKSSNGRMVAGRMIALGFAPEAVIGALSHSKAAYEAFEAGDASRAEYELTHAVTSGAMATLMTRHAAGAETPATGATFKWEGKIADGALDIMSKPFKGDDLGKLYNQLSAPTKKQNKAGAFDDKIKTALPAFSEIIDENPNISSPKEFGDAIRKYQSARDGAILSKAAELKGRPETEMPGIADEVFDAVDKHFDESPNHYSPEEKQAAFLALSDHLRLSKTVDGKMVHDAEPDLFETEGARQRFNEDTKANYDGTKKVVPPAEIAAKQVAANVLRDRIDSKYDELGISGVKEWRQQEAGLISVRDAIENQTQKAINMGDFSAWKSFINQIKWKAVALATLGGEGFHVGGTHGAAGAGAGLALGVGGMLADVFHQWRVDQTKNPNVLIQKILNRTADLNAETKRTGGKLNNAAPEFGSPKPQPKQPNPVQGPQTQAQVSGVRLPVTQGPLEAGATAVRSPLEAAVEAGNGVQPTGSGPMAPTESRKSIPESRFPEGHTEDSFHHHELGHWANAAIEGTKTSDIASHEHPDIANVPRSPGGIGYDDKPIIKQRNAVTSHSPEELIEDTRKWLSHYVAGAVANELIDGIPIHENSGLVGDVRQMKELLKRHGIEGDEASQEIEMAIDRARKNLSKPGVLDMIKSNAQVREENLHPTLHYSRGRLMSMAEQLRGLDEEPNPDGTEGQRERGKSDSSGAPQADSARRATDTEGRQTGREAAQDDSGRVKEHRAIAVEHRQIADDAANSAREFKAAHAVAATANIRAADYIGLGHPDAERASETAKEFSKLANAEKEQRSELKGGVREHSTGFEDADKAIKEGGGVPGGLFGDREGSHVKMFHDDESGTTLGFTNKEKVTPEAVRQKLADSRFEYKALEPDGWAKEAERTAKETGGFTIKPGTDKSGAGSVPKDGFMVELHPEARETLDRTPTARDIFEFTKKNKALLASHPELHVGGYGKELNISGRFGNEAKAVEAAKKLDQISIWDVKSAKEIPTGGSSGQGPFDEYPAEQRTQDLNASQGPAKEPFSGTHYSKVERDTLLGSERGNAAAGAEAARLQHDNKVPGVYAYRDGVKPEEQIAARAFQYAIKGDKAIADIGGKDKALMQDAFTQAFDKYKAAGENDTIAQQKALNDAEAHLRDTGYDGYERNGSTFLYGDQAIHRSPLEGAPRHDVQKVINQTPEQIKAERLHDMAEQFDKAFNEPIHGRSPLEGDRVSTRVTAGKKATENHMEGEPLVINRAALDDRLREKFAGKMKAIDGVKIPKNLTDPDKITDRAVRHFADNLKHIYGLVPPDKQVENGKWYESAHNMTKEIAEQNDSTHPQVAGATAALSPQMDWDMNVAQMKRLVDTMKNKQDATFTSEMIAKGEDIVQRSRANQKPTAKPANQRIEEIIKRDIAGKKFSELTDPFEKAAFIRLYDETYGNQNFPHIDPGTGEERELRTNTDGSPAKLAWGNLDNIVKAISIMEDGSRENISDKIGDSHKVRNFYNNIIDPTNPDDVTIDTHAVAASTLLPLGGDGTEVLDNFGKAGKSVATGVKGTYPIHADSYRLAAKELGILPRALQSVTWEKIRELFPAEWKTEANLAAVKSIWKDHQNGEITGKEAREQITDMAASAQAQVAVKRAAKNAEPKVPGHISALDFLEALRQHSANGKLQGRE